MPSDPDITLPGEPSVKTGFPNAGSGQDAPRGSTRTGARLVAGTTVAGRYRIVTLLGSGGMGEVYRADDLELGQSVALKFLPLSLTRDTDALERLRGEVRVARQVAHPNVCRVYDIAASDFGYFLTMEYIDGEDLASVLRRVGRLSPERATQIGTQICSGLAAAHDLGVLHRDLKPANIMLDGRGKARLTDFGLAALQSAENPSQTGGSGAGTPAYMAPEQLDRKSPAPATVSTEIYSLGLVLFELFTGKPAIAATSLADIADFHSRGSAPSTTSLVKDLDPAIERAIARCLDPDPARRPTSAIVVAASLPGGDPLAAALAAGETPSPQMVADSTQAGLIPPTLAIGLFLSVLASLAVWMATAAHFSITAGAPMPKSPAVLEDRARSILTELGHDLTAYDTASGFSSDRMLVKQMATTQPAAAQQILTSTRPMVMSFNYLQHAAPLTSADYFEFSERVGWNNPPPLTNGMAFVRLDASGRLQLLVIPSLQVTAQSSSQASTVSGNDTQPASWVKLFSLAGLELADYRTAEPIYVPAVPFDHRYAWLSATGNTDEPSGRIEVATRYGKVVSFRMLSPARIAELAAASTYSGITPLQILGMVMFLGIMGGAIFMGYRNSRAKRGDVAGALKLAWLSLGLCMFAWLASDSRLPLFDATFLSRFLLALSAALLTAFIAGGTYHALEPYVRRQRPAMLVGWVRLLAGRFTDPLVGRDILIGLTLGLAPCLLRAAVWLPPGVADWLKPGYPSLPLQTSLMGGALIAIGFIANYIVWALANSAIALVMPILAQSLLRVRWLSVAVIYPAFGLTLMPTGSDGNWNAGYAILATSVYFFAAQRFGLLAGAAAWLSTSILARMPMGPTLSHFASTPANIALVFLLLLAGFGFYTSLAGRSLLRDSLAQK